MSSQFQLIMRQGPTPGATFALEGDQITVGRDSTNEIVINDVEISRRHARLNFQGGKYVLEDLGSTNGTFVNGQRLAGPRVLKAGEVVSFGEQIVLVFEMTTIDAGATLASPRSAMPVRPVTVPPPPAQYAGSVPATPIPVTTPAPAAKTNLVPILVIGGVLFFICFCAVILWYIDSNYLWCTFFPFIPNCP